MRSSQAAVDLTTKVRECSPTEVEDDSSGCGSPIEEESTTSFNIRSNQSFVVKQSSPPKSPLIITSFLSDLEEASGRATPDFSKNMEVEEAEAAVGVRDTLTLKKIAHMRQASEQRFKIVKYAVEPPTIVNDSLEIRASK